MIFITGCARSGTSLTTKILQAHGLYLGHPRQINDLYEHVEIRQTILKPMLAAVGADPLGQGPLPDMTKFRPDGGLRDRVLRHFNCLDDYGYKDAKLTLTWPMWHAAFPEAKWIIVRRETDAIVDSCLRTHFMRRYLDDRRAWTRWVDYHLDQFTEMKKAGLDIHETWPATFISKPAMFWQTAEFSRLEFHLDRVRDAIDTKLWRS